MWTDLGAIVIICQIGNSFPRLQDGIKAFFLGFLDGFFPRAGNCFRLGETLGDVDEAGSADSLDIFWTLITGLARGNLTDVFLLKTNTDTLATHPTISRQAQLSDPRCLQLLVLRHHL